MIGAAATYFDTGVFSTNLGSIGEWYTDLDTSVGAPEQNRQRQLLIAAINHLSILAEGEGYSAIPNQAIASASEFVRNLPTNRELPRVGVDSDGEILIVWDGTPPSCSMTFVGGTLHMVLNPGANSRHIEPTIYNGGHIPPNLLQHIPVRRG